MSLICIQDQDEYYQNGTFTSVLFQRQIPIHIGNIDYKWNILGYEVLKDAEGTVLIGGGLGYFLSYELGTFLAQCINFPLQRNITFHSKGKISWQIFWYFIQ